jgi:HSP20 family protein
MKLESVKEGVESLWDNLAEGWRHLTRSAAGALTRFKPGDTTSLPGEGDIDDPSWLPSRGWAMLGGDVFEDDTRLVVRLEVPGMDKEDLEIEIRGDVLIVFGEKRFSHESTEGRWRVLQCAYGSFHREVPLTAPVLAEQARATYTNGVLRVELPKAAPGRPASTTIKVD